MTTYARFDFAAEHQPGTCTPESGVIRGTLHADLGGGTYTIAFLIDDRTCATVADVATEGDPVELAVEHDCGAGPHNVTVRIERTRPGPPATRTQIPLRVCLA